ncbi:11196_t:CDS:1, partial [Acaulospora colombiana]
GYDDSKIAGVALICAGGILSLISGAIMMARLANLPYPTIQVKRPRDLNEEIQGDPENFT